MGQLERKNYPQLGNVVGPYVHAVKYQSVLYVSGLTAFGSEAQHHGIAAQAQAIFDQLAIIAAEEQSSMAGLIKVTIFITDFSHLTALREVLFARFGEHLPASSLVQVTQLFSPDLKIEIEACFALGE
ncbi:RidA family protein [Erwiniaceae bacterium BAC15a-03b]|uniref:RidA family protein n=1 Tax=Winslowiella arboricola TaxID=2978220 RepID=A0A9J6PGJ9_9GAMM|nr:RidA family protein [Winslowiella arboricola]MCU5771172.1 RidA family protein [Winslowiella arboricola]MCU5776490.1 RidA family protein [Winslowiella arboricola]